MITLEQYRLIVESSPNMIWRSNLTTECDYFNNTWLAFTGRTFEQEKGFGWASGVHPDDYDRCVKIYLDHFHRHERFEMDYRLLNQLGEYRWINDRGVPFYNKKGEFTGFIGSCADVTEKIEGRLMKTMAQNDFLCNTFNRQYAYQVLGDLFSYTKITNLPICILMIDIDDFKLINDHFSHAIGDSVLKWVAALIKLELRTRDVIGRYGGDEFLIGLVQTPCEEGLKIATRIQHLISNSQFPLLSENPIHVTVSIGLKCYENEKTLDDLVNAADNNLYAAKKSGKNQVVG